MNSSWINLENDRFSDNLGRYHDKVQLNVWTVCNGLNNKYMCYILSGFGIWLTEIRFEIGSRLLVSISE